MGVMVMGVAVAVDVGVMAVGVVVMAVAVVAVGVVVMAVAVVAVVAVTVVVMAVGVVAVGVVVMAVAVMGVAVAVVGVTMLMTAGDLIMSIHRMSIAGMHPTVSIQCDMEKPSGDQRFHPTDDPVRYAGNQHGTREESGGRGANHRQRQAPDRSDGASRTLNRYRHRKTHRESVKDDGPRKQPRMIFERQDRTVHQEVNRYGDAH